MPNDYHYTRKRHREWREKVLRRAKYLCQECSRYGKRTPATTAHHIKERKDYPELQYVVSNGLALCSACHSKAHPEKGGGGYSPPVDAP
ncbi:MAG: HNH endonuclease [Clostridiales bacterium]|nr:HNH endonuclease [Clostridiales bacterium]